jgi:hypothetical protein
MPLHRQTQRHIPTQLAQELAAALIGKGFALSELCLVLPDLEQIFLELTTRTIRVAA